MGVRTFLALDLDEAIRQRIVEAQQRIGQTDAKVKWVEPENMHVTLKFLGDVEEDKVGGVCDVVAEVAGGLEPFGFDVQGVLPVPPRGRQLRMLWVGVQEPTGRLAALHEQLDKALASLGFEAEGRRFAPHITLGRIKSAKDPAALRQAAAPLVEEPFGTQQAGQVTIYSSRLTPTGPIYTVLRGATLGP